MSRLQFCLGILGDPQLVNRSPVGLARFCTLRNWLSQWSYDAVDIITDWLVRHDFARPE